MSQVDFSFRQFGAGTVIGILMETIIGEYMEVLNNRVGRR